MKRKIILMMMLCLCFVMTMAQDFKAHTGTVPGSYNFWFYDPETEHDPNAHFPLLIFLHGRSLCGRNLAQVKRYGPIDAVAKGRVIDTYILAPQNPGGAWSPSKIMQLIEWAEKNYHVDSSRIYVYGMSLGGYGTIDMAATYPDRIACAMALCGGGSVKDLSGLNRLPLWIVHGTADRAVPVSASDRVAEAIRATGDASRLIYTRLPGVDHGRPSRLFYLRQTYDWMFSHSLNDPGRPINRDFVITPATLNQAYRDRDNVIDNKIAEYDD